MRNPLIDINLVIYPLLDINLALYLVAALLFSLAMINGARAQFGNVNASASVRKLHTLGFALTLAAMLLNLFGVCYRWWHFGHCPFINKTEVLYGFAFFVALNFFILGRKESVVGFFAAMLSGILQTVVYFKTYVNPEGYLSPNLKAILNSFWNEPHILMYFLGYGALALSCGLGLVGILIWIFEKWKSNGLDHSLTDKYDQLNYRITLFGYVFISIALFIGMAWAQGAWSDYWGWDIKEVFALISWLLYTTYLHLRHLAGWAGVRCQAWTFAAFIAVGITFMFVGSFPMVGSSPHVYSE